MKIQLDDLTHPAVHTLLEEHMQNMHALSPAGSCHVLDLQKLRAPDITFWSAWEGDDLAAVGALKELSPSHGEVKSMRTPAARRRTGAARAILEHIIATAKARGYVRLSLETGTAPAFKPAQVLYESVGFTECGPFGD